MRLPKMVEPRKLAQKNGAFDGYMLPEDMPRVMSAIASCERLNARIEFDIDVEHRRIVKGEITGSVHLQCQRCLDPVEHKLSTHVYLGLAWDEEKAEQLPKTIEPWIVGEDPENLHEILEEEILLSLPVVAAHDYDCIDSALYSSGDPVKELEKRPNPFQALQVLKNTPDK